MIHVQPMKSLFWLEIRVYHLYIESIGYLLTMYYPLKLFQK